MSILQRAAILETLRDANVLPRVPRWFGWVFLAGIFIFLPAHFFPLSGKAINNIFYTIIGFPVLVAVILSWRDWRQNLQGLGALAAFMVAMAISAAALGEFEGLKSILYVAIFCIGIGFLARRAPDLAQAAYLFFAIIALGALAYVAIDWFTLFREHGLAVRMGFAGASGSPHFSALLIVSGIAYLWVFHLDRRVRNRGWHALWMMTLFMLATLSLVIFQSRSGSVGFVIFLLFYGLFRGYLSQVSLLIVAALLLVFVTGAYEVMLQRGLSYRPDIWLDAMTTLYHECSPWFGCGRHESTFLGKYSGTHSAYFGTLYRYGLVGALGLLVFLAVFLVRGFRSRSDWFLISLIGWGSVFTMLDGFSGSPSAWWVYLWFPTMVAAVMPAKQAVSLTPARDSALGSR